MSSPFLNPSRPGPEGHDWAARLIPGAACALPKAAKKPPRGVGERAEWRIQHANPQARRASTVTGSAGLLAPLLPRALEGRRGERWLRAALVDILLLTLNWALVAAGLSVAFPHAFQSSGLSGTGLITAGLAGFGFLHGTLIALFTCAQRPRNQAERWGAQARVLGKAVFWASAVLSAAVGLQGFSVFAIIAVWSAGILQVGALLAWRWYERERHGRGSATRDRRNVLIVGAGELGRRVSHYLEKHPEMDRTVCGFLDDWKPPGNGVIGRISDLAKLARTGFVDELILAGPHDRECALRVLREAQQLRLDVKMAPDLFGCEPACEIERIGGVLLVSLHEEHPPFSGLLMKRVVDVAGATAALALFAPALALIALLIKGSSPGPVFYAALRAGRKGRPFRCYKFRTMVKDADDLKGKLRERNQRRGAFFKIKDDPRITRAGRFLRRYSLDELPQLWNVLRGEMSLVGPRPHTLDDFSAYAIEHLSRLDVTPGITGLWQVTARRDPSFQTGVD
ncbi:MAG: exopolysaccharide biosynthesis polyprenyl glycosylphosphotransferase, partial [Candidatus Sulfotelmatobacter sp.]